MRGARAIRPAAYSYYVRTRNARSNKADCSPWTIKKAALPEIAAGLLFKERITEQVRLARFRNEVTKIG